MAFKTSDIQAHISSSMVARLGHAEIAGLDVVKDNLMKMMREMARAGSFRTKEIADHVLEEAKNLVPYNRGALFDTGKVVGVKSLKRRFENLELGYYISFGDPMSGVDYALLVHENPQGWDFNQHPERWPPGYPGPKMAKYLELPADNAAGKMLGEIKEAVEQAVAGVLNEVKSGAALRPRLVKKAK
jgi:hypothetical protein